MMGRVMENDESIEASCDLVLQSKRCHHLHGSHSDYVQLQESSLKMGVAYFSPGTHYSDSVHLCVGLLRGLVCQTPASRPFNIQETRADGNLAEMLHCHQDLSMPRTSLSLKHVHLIEGNMRHVLDSSRELGIRTTSPSQGAEQGAMRKFSCWASGRRAVKYRDWMGVNLVAQNAQSHLQSSNRAMRSNQIAQVEA